MLLDLYASEPIGGGEQLEERVKEILVAELAKLPHAFSILAYVDGQPAGLVNCFEVFSTFTCKAVINIHDVMVIDEYRGRGICRRMLEKVEEIARITGCCKMTLEVLSGNASAKSAYNKFGFSNYALAPNAGETLFWEKMMSS